MHTTFTQKELELFCSTIIKASLDEAAKQARIIDDPNSYTGNTGSEYEPDKTVDKNSILECHETILQYSLELSKVHSKLKHP